MDSYDTADSFWGYQDVAPEAGESSAPTLVEAQNAAQEARTRNPEVDTDVATAMAGIAALLRLMGEDPERPGLVGTPARVVKSYLEIASRPGDPGRDLAVVFADIDHPDTPVTVGPIPFVSLCEHHLLPFTGEAWVSYVPNLGRVVGLSKLPRTVHHYAARPQVQERLTTQIADALTDHLDPTGVGVLIRGEHTCMSLRGAKTTGALMETLDLRGTLNANPFRSLFLDTTKGGHR